MSTPCVKAPLTKDLDGDPYSEYFSYASIVGMLLYLTRHSRTDISYSLIQVARFTLCPKRSHEAGLKLIFWYLFETHNKGLIITPTVIWIFTRILMQIFLVSTITKSTMIPFVCESELALWSMFLDALCYGSPSFNQRQIRALFSQMWLLLQIVVEISFPSLPWLMKWELLSVWYSLITQRCMCAFMKTMLVRLPCITHFLFNSLQPLNIMR